MSSLSNVNSFELRITHTLHEVPGLTQFMACLPSVEIIVMEEPMLCHLGTYAPPKGSGAAVKVLFPALKTLALGSFTPSPEGKSDNIRDPISKYIMGRIACGHAISVIDFTAVNFGVLPNMEFLTKASGLKVLWQKSRVADIQEYICGAGAPKTLGHV